MTQPIDTLPLHLGLMMMNWLSSQSVWHIAKNDLQHSKTDSTSISDPLLHRKNQRNPRKENQKNPEKPQLHPQQKRSRPLKPQEQKQVARSASEALESLQKLEALLDPRYAAATTTLQTGQPTTRSPRSKKPSLEQKTKANQKNSDSELFRHYLDVMDHPEMLDAIRQESYHRANEMLRGLEQFQSVDWTHRPSPAREIWRSGAATLLDFGGDSAAPAIFCIPSLINKPYILDLYPRRSLIKHFESSGFRVLLLDWGEPGTLEKRYDCADYVQQILVPAFRHIRSVHEGPIYLMGYCMGGIFALALAQLESFYTDGLILLATPWDFQSDQAALALDEETIAAYETLILDQDVLPPVWIQTLFHMINPWHFQEKFQRFPYMSRDEKRHFIAVESWVNDGVPLSRHVARECLVDWPYKNTLAEGKWRVGGWRIDPARITCPTLIMAPTEDRIVPLQSSLPLADLIPKVTCLKPQTGHVSMVVGKKAPAICWKPVLEWISALHNS